MEHFSAQAWIDLVRKTGSQEQTVMMQQHLDQGCSECSKSVEIWRKVMEKTNALNQMQPPAASLRAVKAGFALRKVVAFPSGKLDLATLHFDSARQPLAAGMRSGHATARQLLYKSGSVCIDMRMQPTPGSESIVLIGQLLDSMSPGQGMGGVSVSLMSKGDTVSRKKTNDAGEFDFGLEPLRDVQLVFGIGDSRTIVVSVPEGGSNKVM
jgi:hypothetical protein